MGLKTREEQRYRRKEVNQHIGLQQVYETQTKRPRINGSLI